MTSQMLWLDQPDAAAQLNARAGSNDFLKQIGAQIIDTGFAVVPNLIPQALCDGAVDDFRLFTQKLGSKVEKFKDSHGRFLRLVNLHQTSENALGIGLNKTIMDVLDFLFGMKAAIYTSLYFEYGTQQPIHRDSPFFETFPRNYFMGVWVALEDIDPASGPLMYVPKGHRFACDPAGIYQSIKADNGKASKGELINLSLERYYGEVMNQSASISSPVSVPLKKGDVAFWHPMLPHGGSPATNPDLTRRSIVFHCAPESKQVYQHDVFFSHSGATPPPARYGFTDHNDRKVASAGGTAFQLPG